MNLFLVAGFLGVTFRTFQHLSTTNADDLSGKFSSLSEGGIATRHLHLQGCVPWFTQWFSTRWAQKRYK